MKSVSGSGAQISVHGKEGQSRMGINDLGGYVSVEGKRYEVGRGHVYRCTWRVRASRGQRWRKYVRLSAVRACSKRTNASRMVDVCV